MKNKSNIYYILISIITYMFYSSVLAALPSDTLMRDSVEAEAEIEQKYEALIYQLDIEGAIGTVTNDRVEQAIELAEENNADLLLITLFTPGGFSNATRSICSSILNSDVPVCVYVSPAGSHAGSAGVYITYSAHIAAMAHSTNIGSAHPVSGDGQEVDSVMNEKVTNDAVAQIKSYAEKRNRNIEWAEKAVRESVNITDKEALAMNVIDYRAETIDDLLAQINGKKIETAGGEKTLAVEKRKIEIIEMTFAEKILNLISDPNIVFILMSIAMLGITLELYNPGSILPGVVGVISLILILYASSVMPFNYAGIALILFSAILFIAEIKVVSHGILTIGGLVSLFLGGTMLIDTVDPTLQVSMSVLITVIVIVGLLLVGALALIMKDRKRKIFIGNEGLIGKIAEVRSEGFVYLDGALWKAECVDEILKGDKVEILEVDKLMLKVKKI